MNNFLNGIMNDLIYDNSNIFFQLIKNNRNLRELGYRAGVNQVHPHRFRRTFATKLLHKGVPIDQIQKFLGHSQIETTQLYASSNDEKIEYNHKRYVN